MRKKNLTLEGVILKELATHINNEFEMLTFNESKAYWVRSDGNIIGTHGSHTSTVIENPEYFGLKKEEADNLFGAGEEPAILKKIVGMGWIRIRFFGGYYFISVNELSEDCQKMLTSWATTMLKFYKEQEKCIVIIEELLTWGKSKMYLKNITNREFTHNNSLEIDPNVMIEYENWSLIDCINL